MPIPTNKQILRDLLTDFVTRFPAKPEQEFMEEFFKAIQDLDASVQMFVAAHMMLRAMDRVEKENFK